MDKTRIAGPEERWTVLYLICLCFGIILSRSAALRWGLSPWTLSAMGGFGASVFACLALLETRGRRLSRAAPPTILVPAAFFMLGVSVEASGMLAPGIRIPQPISQALTLAGDYFCGIIEGNFRHAGLLKALLLGRKDGLDAGVKAAFRAAGASHILALSGLHLGIIYAVADSLLPGRKIRTGILPKLRAAVLSGFCIVYMLVAGNGPSLQRAMVFVVVREVSRLQFTRVNLVQMLCTAAFVQLCFLDPENLFSLGFQLSYLAVTGIAVIFPYLRDFFPAPSKKERFTGAAILKKVWDLCALSISCQVTTAPLVYIYFKAFPARFLLTNLLAVPLTTAVVASAMGVTVALAAFPDADLNLAVKAVDWLCGALVWIVELIAS